MLKPVMRTEIESNIFFKFYWFLIRNKKYSGMKNDSKMVYCMYMDRTSLSIENNWTNENGEVYIIYTNEEMQQDLNMSRPTLTKCKKELTDCGLIKEQRQGLNRPNLIFLFNDTFDSSYEKPLKKSYVVDKHQEEPSIKPDSKPKIPDKPYSDKSSIAHKDHFEKLWQIILNNPKTKGTRLRQGKSAVKTTQQKKLMKVDLEILEKCLQLYLQQGIKKDYYMLGSTWFNGRYEDFVDEAKKMDKTMLMKDKIEIKAENTLNKNVKIDW